ncbi:MAG TPA: glycosyl hydrolase [Blastococcus sp.]
MVLVVALGLSGLLLAQPAGLSLPPRTWAFVAILAVVGALTVGATRPRPRHTVPVLAIAVVGSLAAYILLAAPVEPETGAEAAGPASTPPAISSAVPTPVAPRPPQRPILGISTSTLDQLDRFVGATGTNPEVFDLFEPWSRNRPLDTSLVDSLAARGARLSITWEPWDPDGSHTRQPRYSLASIIAGKHDPYIDLFASSIGRLQGPVTIRLMHEMNGNWYPWAARLNGNRPGEFVRAWQHVHDRFAALGVTNVVWMWAPNAIYPGAAPLAPLYPGDAYVDAVGVSNYNWGDFRRQGVTTQWATFGELFDESISELRALSPRPVWIAEVGSSDNGGSKADWLAATLQEVAQRPEITGLVWFDHVDEGVGVDWRIELDLRAAAAWRTGFMSRPPA